MCTYSTHSPDWTAAVTEIAAVVVTEFEQLPSRLWVERILTVGFRVVALLVVVPRRLAALFGNWDGWRDDQQAAAGAAQTVAAAWVAVAAIRLGRRRLVYCAWKG